MPCRLVVIVRPCYQGPSSSGCFALAQPAIAVQLQVTRACVETIRAQKNLLTRSIHLHRIVAKTIRRNIPLARAPAHRVIVLSYRRPASIEQGRKRAPHTNETRPHTLFCKHHLTIGYLLQDLTFHNTLERLCRARPGRIFRMYWGGDACLPAS